MTEPTKLLRLDRLTLRNFRCFGELPIDLHPSLTVIVADNGMGKTATLDAIGLALDVFVSELAYKKQSIGFDRTDVSLRLQDDRKMVHVLPTEFSATGFADSTAVTWGRSILRLGEQRARNTSREAKAIRVIAHQLRERADAPVTSASEGPQTLPLVAFYGTGRLWREHYLTEGKRSVWPTMLGRYSAYIDCMSGSSSVKGFVAWYEATASAARSAVSKAFGPDERPHEHLAAVREAVRIVLEPSKWGTIDWEFPSIGLDGLPDGPGCLVAEHSENGRIPVARLSDGIRTMLALVGDLAFRCVRLNPHLGELAAQQTPGVLLIDEIDMHLHPTWQQIVVKLLQDAFPKMQMVLSTHSPQVVSTVRKENIRILEPLQNGTWIAREPTRNPYAHSNMLSLEAVMGGAAYPPVPLTEKFREYQCLVGEDKHDSERALELRAMLEAEWGRTDNELLLMDVAIRKNETLRKLRKQQT